jgi:hypothetical protein
MAKKIVIKIKKNKIIFNNGENFNEEIPVGELSSYAIYPDTSSFMHSATKTTSLLE